MATLNGVTYSGPSQQYVDALQALVQKLEEDVRILKANRGN